MEGAPFEVDRCDRAALEDAADQHLVRRGHGGRLACLDDRNLLALIGVTTPNVKNRTLTVSPTR
jgi:hypothetical protein